jgi:hypothetical protein
LRGGNGEHGASKKGKKEDKPSNLMIEKFSEKLKK